MNHPRASLSRHQQTACKTHIMERAKEMRRQSVHQHHANIDGIARPPLPQRGRHTHARQPVHLLKQRLQRPRPVQLGERAAGIGADHDHAVRCAP